MKKEDEIIRQSLLATQEYDERLSAFATKNSDYIKIHPTHTKPYDFDVRWPYEKDIDRILYSKAYRRYVDKTQALSFFNNVHITKRSLHVQWVSRIARQIGRCLNLNTDLIEAIALGHDLGHAPYGHVGEKAINECLKERGVGYFAHNANSVRVLLYVERKGEGYNVSLQVLDGILCHNGEMINRIYKPDPFKTIDQFWKEYEACWHTPHASEHISPMTLEGCVVRISDVISYVGKDIDDAINVGLMKRSDLPSDITRVIGDGNNSMINHLVEDLVIHSYNKPYLEFSKETFEALNKLYDFISIHIHHNPVLVKENEKLFRMVKELYDVFYEDLDDPLLKDRGIQKYLSNMNEEYHQTPKELIVSDYLSGMTDTYLLEYYKKVFLPTMRENII